MTAHRLGLRVAGAIFGLICLGHVIRLLANIAVEIGGRPIPMWPSVMAAVITGALGIWLWTLSRGGPRT